MDLEVAFLVAALVLVAQSSTVPADSDRILLKGETAIAYGDDGTPLFKGKRDYLLGVAQNQDGHVTLYDSERRMVRISDPKVPGLWLNCSELLPMKEACGASPPPQSSSRRPSRGGPPRPVPLGAIPACPGDPRCPQL